MSVPVERPAHLKNICHILILSGIFSVAFVPAAIFLRGPMAGIFKSIPFPGLSFYFQMPEKLAVALLDIRFFFAVLQIITGVYLYRLRFRAMYAARVIILIALSSTFLNPYYPDSLILVATFFYSLLLFALSHHDITFACYRAEIARNNRTVKKRVRGISETEALSRGVVICGILQIVLGLELFRSILWTVPDGLTLEFITRKNDLIGINLPKLTLLLTAALFYMSGVLTFGFKHTGRMLNVLFGGFGFLAACVMAFLVQRPENGLDKFTYAILLVLALVSSTIVLFLLTNPNVKSQFAARYKMSGMKKTLRTIGFGIVCFFVYSAITLLVRTAPPDLTEPRPGYAVNRQGPHEYDVLWNDLTERIPALKKISQRIQSLDREEPEVIEPFDASNMTVEAYSRQGRSLNIENP